MKKVLLIIGILVALVIAGFVIKTDFQTERSVTIDADKETVYAVLGDFNKFTEWNPWGKLDSNMTYTVEGEPGTEGHSYSWTSDNREVGTGTMSITYMNENTIAINVGFEGQDDVESGYTIEETDAGTMVTWWADGDVPMILGLFLDMDAMIGEKYESGLSDLQAMIETMEPEAGQEYTVEMVDLPVMTMVGYRESVAISKMDDMWTDEKIGGLMGAVGGAGVDMGPVGALYYIWDEENDMTDMAVTVSVPEGTVVEGYSTMSTPAMSTLKTVHYGGYETIEDAHMAIMAYMDANGLTYKEDAPAIELYTVPMGEGVAEEDLVTEIYHPVVKAE